MIQSVSPSVTLEILKITQKQWQAYDRSEVDFYWPKAAGVCSPNLHISRTTVFMILVIPCYFATIFFRYPNWLFLQAKIKAWLSEAQPKEHKTKTAAICPVSMLLFQLVDV